MSLGGLDGAGFSPWVEGMCGQMWVLSPPLSSANLPGGTVQSAGKPRQQPSCPRGGWLADQELPDIQGPRHQGSVPTEMARHRRQRPQGGQELRKFGDLFFSTWCFLMSCPSFST